MRVVCLEGGLDLNTVLQGVSTSIERQLGCMEKSRFVATLQKAFANKLALTPPIINAICLNYPAIDAGLTGGVAWRIFLNDLVHVHTDVRTTELRQLCVQMRRHVADRQFDLTSTFGTALRAGRERALGMMDKGLFKSVLNNAFMGLMLPPDAVEDICLVWRFGDADPFGGYQCVAWKKFCVDLMSIEPERDPGVPVRGPAVGLNTISDDLYEELQLLRRHALSKQLDMTDVFEEVATGREKTMGVMDKTQFIGAMSNLFGFGALKRSTLADICLVYGAGEPDRQRGGYVDVRWKQFAIQFDLFEPAQPEGVRPMPEWMVAEMRALRRTAVQKMLDMSDAFSEICEPGREKNMGLMERSQFISALGVLLAGSEIKQKVVDAITHAYGTGGWDAVKGGFRLVRWKQFAADFDDIEPTQQPNDSPWLPPWLTQELLLLRRAAINKRLDLSDAFECRCEPGREKNLGVMDQTQFCCTMGELFGGLKQEVLRAVCEAYAAPVIDGAEKALPDVRFKRFANDFDALLPPVVANGSAAETVPEWLLKELAALRRIAITRRIDLSNCFEDQWVGPSREKLLGVMDKTQFMSVMGILFAGAQKFEVLQALCEIYGAGDPDARRGGLELVRWKDFAEDFDEVEPAELYLPGQLGGL